MNNSDISLRNTTYQKFVELGGAPSVEQVAEAEGITDAQVMSGWKRLHQAHALVLDDEYELLMLNPFSAIPTGYRVVARGREWYANCAWDAFGVCAALAADGRIEATCPDCRQPLTVQVENGKPSDETLVFHSLVAAPSWWNDIGYT